VGVVAKNVTAEQLFRMPDDGFRYELVRGELRKMTPAGFRHGAIIIRLSTPLAAFVDEHHLGVVAGAETGFKILSDPDTVRAPDVAFVRQDRIPREGPPETFWPGAPDLAVEVISPSDTVYEVEEKVAEWLSAGTRMVWVVHPKRRVVEVHRPSAKTVALAEQDALDGGDIVPGFRLQVAEIFR